MTLRVFKLMNIRNRAYVIDAKGNKLFYGTMYQCGKFIEYMKGDESNGVGSEGIRTDCRIEERQNRDMLDA